MRTIDMLTAKYVMSWEIIKVMRDQHDRVIGMVFDSPSSDGYLFAGEDSPFVDLLDGGIHDPCVRFEPTRNVTHAFEALEFSDRRCCATAGNHLPTHFVFVDIENEDGDIYACSLLVSDYFLGAGQGGTGKTPGEAICRALLFWHGCFLPKQIQNDEFFLAEKAAKHLFRWEMENGTLFIWNRGSKKDPRCVPIESIHELASFWSDQDDFVLKVETDLRVFSHANIEIPKMHPRMGIEFKILFEYADDYIRGELT